MSVLTNIKTFGSKVPNFMKKAGKGYKRYHKTIDKLADFLIDPSISTAQSTLEQGVTDYGMEFSQFKE